MNHTHIWQVMLDILQDLLSVYISAYCRDGKHTLPIFLHWKYYFSIHPVVLWSCLVVIFQVLFIVKSSIGETAEARTIETKMRCRRHKGKEKRKNKVHKQQAHNKKLNQNLVVLEYWSSSPRQISVSSLCIDSFWNLWECISHIHGNSTCTIHS